MLSITIQKSGSKLHFEKHCSIINVNGVILAPFSGAGKRKAGNSIMEPLNDILGRVTPRRQSTPSSKAAQPSQPPTRQQSPEQMARLRQKYPYGSQQQQPDHIAADPRRPQNGSVGPRQPNQSANQESTAYRQPGRYQTSPLQRSQNRLSGHRQTQQQTGHMQPRAQQDLPSTQPPQSIQPLLPSAASK